MFTHSKNRYLFSNLVPARQLLQAEVARRRNIHKHIHGVDFKKRAPQALKEIHEFVMKEMGTPDAHGDTRFRQSCQG